MLGKRSGVERVGRKRRNNPCYSKFEKELKKLECFVNYKEAEGERLGSRK